MAVLPYLFHNLSRTRGILTRYCGILSGIIYTGYFKLFHNQVTTTAGTINCGFLFWCSWACTFTNKQVLLMMNSATTTMVPYRADSKVGVDDEYWVTGGVHGWRVQQNWYGWEMLLYFKSIQWYQINMRRNRRWRPPSKTEVQLMLLLLPRTKKNSTDRGTTISIYSFCQVS